MTSRLRGCLRDGDTAARLGGDEFAILLEDVEDDPLRDGSPAAPARRAGVPFDVGGTEVTTGASIGIAIGTQGRARPKT